MKTFFAMLATSLALIGCGQPQERQAQEDALKVETASIKVGSAVCESCATTIKEALQKVDGVQSVDVNLEAKEAKVQFLPGKASMASMEFAISNAGYDANSVKAHPEAYEKLASCCKIDSKEDAAH